MFNIPPISGSHTFHGEIMYTYSNKFSTAAWKYAVFVLLSTASEKFYKNTEIPWKQQILRLSSKFCVLLKTVVTIDDYLLFATHLAVVHVLLLLVLGNTNLKKPKALLFQIRSGWNLADFKMVTMMLFYTRKFYLFLRIKIHLQNGRVYTTSICILSSQTSKHIVFWWCCIMHNIKQNFVCCHLLGTAHAYAASLQFCLQFLIHSTFVTCFCLLYDPEKSAQCNWCASRQEYTNKQAHFTNKNNWNNACSCSPDNTTTAGRWRLDVCIKRQTWRRAAVVPPSFAQRPMGGLTSARSGRTSAQGQTMTSARRHCLPLGRRHMDNYSWHLRRPTECT